MSLYDEFTREDEVNLAWEDGFAEGMEKAMMDGMEAGRMETARKLFALGLDSEVIRKATTLSQETIATLRLESRKAV
jgi:predicted transposase/invertase (TIGR01784 family)